MNYLLMIIAVLAYAGSILAFSRGAININSNILGTIVNFIGFLVPASLFVLFSSQRLSPGGSTSKGYVWAVFGGLCIGIFTIALTRIFASGENVSFVTPLVYGGAVLVASLMGVVVYKEKTDIFQSLGLLLIVTGILFVSFSVWRTNQ